MRKFVLMASACVIFCASHTVNSSGTYFCRDVNSNYELVYSENLNINEKDIPFKVLSDKNNCTAGVIEIDGQTLPINANLAKNVGYAQGRLYTQDFTGDGKQEIALILCGGASGAWQAVQVFCNENGEWAELSVPSAIYKRVPSFIKEQQKFIGIPIDHTLHYYRTISIDNQRILIRYIMIGDGNATEDVEIYKELIYSDSKKKFILGDTNVIIPSNDCNITTTTTDKAITIKWYSANPESIKKAQIKVATQRNMKGAKTYQLNKGKAQCMSYKFTTKSGDIKANSKYYFKVRVKVGKKWTKWSGAKSAEIRS